MGSSLVGSHYHCESGTSIDQQGVFYSDDPLWDGQQCNSDEASCCPINLVLLFADLASDMGSSTSVLVLEYNKYNPPPSTSGST